MHIGRRLLHPAAADLRQIPLRKDLQTQRRDTLWHRPLDTSCLVPGTRRRGSKWPTSRGSWHHHFSESTVYKTRLHLKVEPALRVVLSSPSRTPEVPDHSRAVLFSKKALKSIWLWLLLTTTPWKVSRWGMHDLVIRFLRGAIRLNPSRPTSIPFWDLSLVLRALQRGPFEPLQTVELKFIQWRLCSCLHWPPSRGSKHFRSIILA